MSAGNFRSHECAARPLGVEILAAERRLDEGFASGLIGPDMLRGETAAIAELQGKVCLVLREPRHCRSEILRGLRVPPIPAVRRLAGEPLGSTLI